MGVATMGNRSQAPAPQEGANEAPAQAAGVVRFVRASDEHVQPGGIDVTRQITANQQDLGVFDIPAYGFLRYIWLFVQATGGAGGGAVAHEDAPFNILQNLALTEPNGAPIVQLSNGYQLYLANKYGGYNPGETCDPRAWRSFSAPDADGDFSFAIRVPVEVGPRDALGALANQDSAGQFKLRLALAGASTVYTTEPLTTLPTVRIRSYIECWDQPEAGAAGMANQVNPPAPGTTSFWTVQSGVSVPSGQFNVELKRKGNFLRNVILVLRDTAGTATRLDAETLWPDETRFERDAFPARYYQDDYWIDLMVQRTGLRAANEAVGGLDNGVRFHDYMHEFDGYLGRETRDLWQPTRGSSRLEFVGNFGGAATLDIITNDVAIAENVFL